MATTKIWPVHNNAETGKTTKATISLVVDYIENEDKTVTWVYRIVTDNLENVYTTDEMSSLDDVIDYAAGEAKTAQKKYVSGVNVSVNHAREEMMTTKKFWHKEDKIILWHGYQSFKPGEVTAEEAHKIGVEMARNLWGENYEVLVATHIDRAHIHNHFVINSVSFNTGKKLDAKWQDMKRESDRLCKKYSKSVIMNPSYAGKHYSEWLAETQHKRTWVTTIKEDIDEAVLMSRDMGEFLKNMSERGYSIKYGAKYFTLRPPGKERFVRIDRRLGEVYSLGGIAERIDYNLQNGNLLVMKQARNLRCVSHPARPRQKLTGFQALYFYYCYQLGVLPKRTISPAKVHYLMREELLRIDHITQETRFLYKHNITNQAELDLYRSDIDAVFSRLASERKNVRNELRRCPDGEKKEHLKEKIKKLNKKIGDIRNEQLMCEDITKHSQDMGNRATMARARLGSIIRENEKEELR